MTDSILRKVRVAALMKWRNGDVAVSKSTDKIREERRKAAEWGAKQALAEISPQYVARILADHEYDSTNVDNCLCGEKVKGMMLEHQSRLISEAVNETI